MTNLREFTPKPLGINVVRFAFAAVLLSGPVAADELADMPVVRWTAGEAADFRYPFFENVKRTTLLHATPETGTFNHHPYLACYQGVLFACWDNHARDENTSGQHGMFCYSTVFLRDCAKSQVMKSDSRSHRSLLKCVMPFSAPTIILPDTP